MQQRVNGTPATKRSTRWMTLLPILLPHRDAHRQERLVEGLTVHVEFDVAELVHLVANPGQSLGEGFTGTVGFLVDGVLVSRLK